MPRGDGRKPSWRASWNNERGAGAVLADEIIADGRRSQADALYRGGLSALGAAIHQSSRYELSVGVMRSAVTVHRGPVVATVRALPLCRLPFRSTWFEWLGPDPFGERRNVLGPDRHAPVPRRFGALVQTDASRQRGTMTWAWVHDGIGLNICPIACAFDWCSEPEEVPDLRDLWFASHGLDPQQSWEIAKRDLYKMPNMKGTPEAIAVSEQERFGLVWSPFVAEFARWYEQRHGPLSPEHGLWQAAIGDITGEPGILRAAILLMNSRNLIATEHVPTPTKLNKAREKRGKPPLLDYTQVRVSMSRALAGRAGSTGEREASRFHAVAGHFKVRKSGIYWWNDHTRGDPTRGTVRRADHMVEL